MKTYSFYLSFILRSVDEYGNNLYCSFPHAQNHDDYTTDTLTEVAQQPDFFPFQRSSKKLGVWADVSCVSIQSLPACVCGYVNLSLRSGKKNNHPGMIRANRLSDKPTKVERERWNACCFFSSKLKQKWPQNKTCWEKCWEFNRASNLIKIKPKYRVNSYNGVCVSFVVSSLDY